MNGADLLTARRQDRNLEGGSKVWKVLTEGLATLEITNVWQAM